MHILKLKKVEIDNIEKFFLNVLLRISLLGSFLVLLSDAILFPQDIVSLIVSAIIFAACALAFLIRKKYSSASVVLATSIVLTAMVYQRLVSPFTTTSLSIVLVVGFVVSIMLKGRVMWIMHGIAF